MISDFAKIPSIIIMAVFSAFLFAPGLYAISNPGAAQSGLRYLFQFYLSGVVIPVIALVFAIHSWARQPQTKMGAAIDGVTKALIWGIVNVIGFIYFNIYVGHAL